MRRLRRVVMRLTGVLWLMMAQVLPANAASVMCDAAAAQAARESGVPRHVLRILTRVETGRTQDGIVEPWPWTLNVGGAGSWHDGPAPALAAAAQALAEGRRNIDIGCFQINHRWHGSAFADLEEMLDPLANARHAARFLLELHSELGDWTAAAGAFHSRTPDHAARYLARYREIGAALGDAPAPGDPARAGDGPAGPAPLSLAARPPLLSMRQAGLLTAARPVPATAARPLWEGF